MPMDPGGRTPRETIARYNKRIKIFCAVVVRFGPKCEDGFLPVFSVDTREEARALLTTACSTDRLTGEWIAEELVAAQTLENL